MNMANDYRTVADIGFIGYDKQIQQEKRFVKRYIRNNYK